jgi:AcrR family transcriptional regulator
MPKVVDHRERRTLIVDALMRVAAEHGLEAVSLRHVAAEAGVTSGMVQHYFRTKDEMMAFAMVAVRERHAARIAEAVGRLGPAPPPRDLVRTMLAEVLPLDEPRRADGRVVLAFLAYAAVRPAAAALLRDDTQWMLGFVADQIRAAQDTGAARAELDPAPAAAGLVGMMEGLGVYLLADQYPPKRALETLDAQLTLIFN